MFFLSLLIFLCFSSTFNNFTFYSHTFVFFFSLLGKGNAWKRVEHKIKHRANLLQICFMTSEGHSVLSPLKREKNMKTFYVYFESQPNLWCDLVINLWDETLEVRLKPIPPINTVHPPFVFFYIQSGGFRGGGLKCFRSDRLLEIWPNNQTLQVLFFIFINSVIFGKTSWPGRGRLFSTHSYTVGLRYRLR